MPSGYTSDICGGEVSFEEFVLGCACWHFRDVSALPERFEPETYHRDEAKKARSELARLGKITPAGAEVLAANEFAKEEARHKKHVRERSARCDRLMRMRMKVADWTPPSPEHEALKRVMIDQLDMSLVEDCRVHEPTHRKLTGTEWLANEIEAARHSIEYHEKYWAEELKRAEKANDWVRKLRESFAKKK